MLTSHRAEVNLSFHPTVPTQHPTRELPINSCWQIFKKFLPSHLPLSPFLIWQSHAILSLTEKQCWYLAKHILETLNAPSPVSWLWWGLLLGKPNSESKRKEETWGQATTGQGPSYDASIFSLPKETWNPGLSRNSLSEVLVLLCVSIATPSMKMPSLLNSLLIQPHSCEVWVKEGLLSSMHFTKAQERDTTYQRS